jgi:two-component system chemotaxis response regulator CheY
MSQPTQIAVTDLSILIVEPSKTQLKFIIRHLKGEGVLNVESSNSGVDALEFLSTFKPDLILSSLYLPDMTATELVLKIKAIDELREIPFMLVSSETRFDALDSIRQAGVVAILPKPFTHKDLKRALRTAVDYIDPEEISFEHYDIEDVRVLVVDDSLMARKHISRVLNNMGIVQITTANDGLEGVAAFTQANEAFDLIVTDFNMPNMDGGQLVEHIRVKLNNPFIPIIMVTSEDNEIRLNSVMQSGVSGICDKPFEPKTVKEMLFRVLG